jgi:hypothetical protein
VRASSQYASALAICEHSTRSHHVHHHTHHEYVSLIIHVFSAQATFSSSVPFQSADRTCPRSLTMAPKCALERALWKYPPAPTTDTDDELKKLATRIKGLQSVMKSPEYRLVNQWIPEFHQPPPHPHIDQYLFISKRRWEKLLANWRHALWELQPLAMDVQQMSEMHDWRTM